jgi:hypothetical protein
MTATRPRREALRRKTGLSLLRTLMPAYDGLIQRFAQRHDVLSSKLILMARDTEDGTLVRIAWSHP